MFKTNLTAVQEERGPRVRSNVLSNPHNSNITWKPRIEPSATFYAHFNSSEIPFKSPAANNTLMMKTLHRAENRENILFPVISRHVQSARIISPGNFSSSLNT